MRVSSGPQRTPRHVSTVCLLFGVAGFDNSGCTGFQVCRSNAILWSIVVLSVHPSNRSISTGLRVYLESRVSDIVLTRVSEWVGTHATLFPIVFFVCIPQALVVPTISLYLESCVPPPLSTIMVFEWVATRTFRLQFMSWCAPFKPSWFKGFLGAGHTPDKCNNHTFLGSCAAAVRFCLHLLSV